ncbi:hypothetical protein GCM10009105_12300 [Dokdonella soli]|uniref:Uncharacterized protein n=1 Tax=Dokdonella soli TaxID=529810 RepID=A0ABN1IEQ3_9GAMM
MANGIATATPSTCNTQRASHAGSRLGHCSNNPNASIATSPSVTVRISKDINPDFQPRPSGSPIKIDAHSVNRTRRHPSNKAKPRGFAGTIDACMV